MTSVSFFEGVEALLKSVKPEVWQSYLQWTILRSTAQMLPKKFVEESFKLFAQITGAAEQRPRWKRCVDSTSGGLGELAGQPFVKTYFAGESKAASEAMVKEISAAFNRGLDTLGWMDAKTKARAHVANSSRNVTLRVSSQQWVLKTGLSCAGKKIVLCTAGGTIRPNQTRNRTPMIGAMISPSHAGER